MELKATGHEAPGLTLRNRLREYYLSVSTRTIIVVVMVTIVDIVLLILPSISQSRAVCI